MSLIDLELLFDDDDLESGFNTEQINFFFEKFKTDFMDNPFMVNGKKIKLIEKVSKVREYSKYPETFVHIITRSLTRERIYDCNRLIIRFESYCVKIFNHLIQCNGVRKS